MNGNSFTIVWKTHDLLSGQKFHLPKLCWSDVKYFRSGLSNLQILVFFEKKTSKDLISKILNIWKWKFTVIWIPSNKRVHIN